VIEGEPPRPVGSSASGAADNRQKAFMDARGWTFLEGKIGQR
jgi:hypothetical protein